MSSVRDENTFDVIVVGAGHAGCEAALVSARMGARTLLLNLYLDNTALMPCNPSIGGPAKGHITREIDALGGEQARATDASTLHIRWLNTSKGPAVRALRAQCDPSDYHRHMIGTLETTDNLYVHQAMATDLLTEDGRVVGVKTLLGQIYNASCVIITTGPYTNGKVFIGQVSFPSGPLGQMPSLKLSSSLRQIGFEVDRLRTDTTPRLHADTIDFKSLKAQQSAAEPLCFSHWGEPRVYRGFSCYLTRSTPRTHEIIRSSLSRSPLARGDLESPGPRYCPSIEDKVIRFPDKESHPIFLEPTSRYTKEIYMQNFSTSLPYDVQVEMVRSIPGCERAHILKPGYAIEYDYFPPTQLHPWLETKLVEGLFFAGQINGTSGYEEAAAQGLIAGINAVLKLRGEEPLVLGRHEAYIGVLIDDLVTKGTREPYRMLTSRCEYRLLLRHDNADRRLAPIGRRLGLIDDVRWNVLTRKWKAIDDEIDRLKSVRVYPSQAVNDLLFSLGQKPIDEPILAYDLLKRPGIDHKFICKIVPPPQPLDDEVKSRVEIEVKYSGYIQKENALAAKMQRIEQLRIPRDMDYDDVFGLSSEGREKLKKIMPGTLGQAGRISGVTPSDLQVLWMYLETKERCKRS